MQKYFPEFKYYYLADYIQNCQRLKYKVEYEPTELLCPVTKTWVYFDEKIRKIIDNGEIRLAEQDVKVAEDFEFGNIDVNLYVLQSDKIDFKNLFKADPNLAARYLSLLSHLVRTLGKKLFKDLNFKKEVVSPFVSNIQKQEEKKTENEESLIILDEEISVGSTRTFFAHFTRPSLSLTINS